MSDNLSDVTLGDEEHRIACGSTSQPKTFENIHQQDTFTSLLWTYRQAKARGEDVMLTLKTQKCVENLQLKVSFWWKDKRERAGWK